MNPRVPRFLVLVTQVECIVVGIAAIVGFFAPGIGAGIWAWTVAPFGARFLGAMYFATLGPLLAFGLSGRWSPGRVVLPMIFTFTTSVGLVMLPYWHQFVWARPATYVFWVLYVFIPINAAVYLYRLRTLPPADAEPTSSVGRTVATFLAIVFGIYGLALLVSPTIAASFWPWPIDAFDGRIYAAIYLAPAVGVWLLRTSGSRAEWKTVGTYLVTLGVLSIVTVLWTSATVPPAHKANFEATGTWAFFALNALTAITGAWMIAKRSATAREF